MSEAEPTQTYGDWSAPKYDGALMVWPDPPTLAATAEANRRALDAADHVVIHGRALPEWRRETRAFLGHDLDAPLVATGHQCELHHPGVWVKNAVINAVADAAGAGAAALHLAVDTDAPKHLKLRWPGFSRPITDDSRLLGAAWSGLLDPPTPGHLDGLLNAAADAARDGRASPLAAEFLADCRRYLIDQRDSPSPMSLAGMTADAEHKLDWSLGLRHVTMLLSGLLECESWAALACHLGATAGDFAASYNAALHEHRAANDLVGTDRPMPDLAVEGDAVELPLWLDDLAAGTRRRARVRRDGDGFVLEVGGGFRFTSDVEPRQLLLFLRKSRLRFSPRALSLTLFLRLFAADLFVHGIGGGHYDAVLDRILRGHLGLEPPTFAVATATLFHQQSVGRERVCLPCLEHEGHALAHAALGEEKATWLREIAARPTFKSRREIFDAMHAARRAALASDAAYHDWLRRRREADRRLAEEAVLFDRELFYAVQPERRLSDLIGRVRSLVSAETTRNEARP